MKSLLTLAIVLASTSAFATRSRITALGSAPHLVDSSTVYLKPAHIFEVADSVTIETGATNVSPSTAGASPMMGAEALLVRTHGDAKWAFSLGHDDAKIFSQRADAGSSIGQQNPIEFTYGMKAGDIAWAATLGYSNFNNKAAEVKDTTTNLKFGAATSTWDVSVDLGLANKTTSATSTTTEDEFEGKSNIAVRGGMWVSSELYAYANVDMGGYETTSSSVAQAEVKTTDITVGAINTMKNDGNEFFWGAGLASSTMKDSVTGATVEKSSSLSLPFIIGMEANAASWLTLRGSVTQSVLIQNEKSESATATLTETSPGTNSTTFAAGAGLKLGKLALDASLLKDATTGADTQKVNTTDLLGTVGLTYAF